MAGAANGSEYFQGEFGRIAADISAARAMLIDSIASHWRQVLAGNAHDTTLPLGATQAGIWIVKTCVRGIDAC